MFERALALLGKSYILSMGNIFAKDQVRLEKFDLPLIEREVMVSNKRCSHSGRPNGGTYKLYDNELNIRII